jgi:diphthine methyl ester synthase
MSIPTAVSQLLEIESLRQEGILSGENTLAVALSRVGGGEDQRIVGGTLKELCEAPPSVFGEPLHTLVIVGKRLHPLESEFVEEWAIDKENWRHVAQEAYGCNFE